MCITKETRSRWRGVHTLLVIAVFVVGMFAGSEAKGTEGLAYPLPYIEDFEVPLTNGMPLSAIGTWTSGALDSSVVIEESYSFAESTGPIDPGTHAQILQLDTGLGGATNFFEVPDANQVVYMDAMLKLAPRSAVPASVTNDPAVQLFFFLNANTNLVVYHGGLDGSAPVMTVLPVNPLTSNAWNRYTVTLDYVHGDAGGIDRKYFKIQLNGMDLTSVQAYSSPGKTGAYDGGAWFFAADQTGPDSISSVAFEGAGGLDDFVVTARAPSFSTTPVHYIASELIGSGALSPTEEVPVVDGASTQIVYQAAAWHEITRFETNGVSVASAIGEKVYTAIFTNVESDINTWVQFVESMAYVDGKTPAGWYGPLGADAALNDEDSDGLSLYEEYLINSDPLTSNVFSISRYDLGGQISSLSWESLGLPNGPVISEVSTNLIQGAWVPNNGYLTYAEGSTTWQSLEVAREAEEVFFRMKVTE